MILSVGLKLHPVQCICVSSSGVGIQPLIHDSFLQIIVRNCNCHAIIDSRAEHIQYLEFEW